VAAPGLWLAQQDSAAAAGLEPLMAPATAVAWRLRRWRTLRGHESADRLRCMAGLTQMSQQRRRLVTEAHQLEYECHKGVLALLRTAAHAKKTQALLDTPLAKSLPVQWLSSDEARRAEPGLGAGLSFQAALRWPSGETGNGRQFAQALKAASQQFGVLFQFQLEVTALRPAARADQRVELQWARCHEFAETMLGGSGGTGATTVPADAEPDFDAAIVCSAEAAARLLDRRAIRSAMDAMHLGSVTAPLREPNEAGEAFAPSGAVVDPARGVTIARMGERVRVAGGARLGPPPARPAPGALARLYEALEENFPGAARTARASPWIGRQWTTRDGLPLVGPSGMPGVWLHCGHGSQAWAWAPATARVVADLVAGRSPELDPAPLAPSRLR
jgi:D-amino-acid dehydrogenase